MSKCDVTINDDAKLNWEYCWVDKVSSKIVGGFVVLFFLALLIFIIPFQPGASKEQKHVLWAIGAGLAVVAALGFVVNMFYTTKMDRRIMAYHETCREVVAFHAGMLTLMGRCPAEALVSVATLRVHVDGLFIIIIPIEKPGQNDDLIGSTLWLNGAVRLYRLSEIKTEARTLVHIMAELGIADGNLQSWYDRAKAAWRGFSGQ